MNEVTTIKLRSLVRHRLKKYVFVLNLKRFGHMILHINKIKYWIELHREDGSQYTLLNQRFIFICICFLVVLFYKCIRFPSFMYHAYLIIHQLLLGNSTKVYSISSNNNFGFFCLSSVSTICWLKFGTVLTIWFWGFHFIMICNCYWRFHFFPVIK